MKIKEKFASELSIIGHEVLIEGNIKGNGNFRIDGKVVGNVFVNGSVTLGNSATIKGHLEATSLSVSGRVEGDIKAMEKLTLEKMSEVKGDIEAKILIVEAGARINGNCLMHEIKSHEKESLINNGEKTK